MPTFGASSLNGSVPTGHLQESSKEVTVELATIRGMTGPIAEASVKPRSITTTICKSKGDATFVAVQGIGSFTSAVTSAKVSQTNDDFTTAEITYTEFN
jgi:hypothetical protein